MAVAIAAEQDLDLTSEITSEAQIQPEATPIGRAPLERTLHSWDGSELYYRAWLPPVRAKQALILLHRGHEHSGRWQEVVDRLDLDDFAIFAWDARGHGRSAGRRGDAESFACLVKDLEAFVRHLSASHGIAREDMALVANSVGSVVAGAWLQAYGPPLRAAVLASPALRVRLYLPFAVPLLRLARRVKPNGFISSYVTGRLLTHDRAKARDYDQDPLITPQISLRVLLGLHDAGSRLLADGGAITTPVLMLSAGRDWVVGREAQQRFFEQLSSPRKEFKSLAGFRHDIFSETERDLPITLTRDYLRRAFARAPADPDQVIAQSARHTQAEFERLRQPLPWHSGRRLGFALNKLSLGTLGRLSQGIRLGWRRGFDSGAMLDYVYQDRARGWTPLGRRLDRTFLDSVGWRGIRQRKANLEAMIDHAIQMTQVDGRPVRLLDIAAGHGRYLLEALAQRRDPAITAHLRDFDQRNLDAAEALAQSLKLPGITFQQGDAFDGPALAALRPRPTIAIVSGLYELFDDNQMVRDSLSGLAAGLEEGGLLIVTNQPWHPQLELIARVLPSHRGGQPWVMRRRSQAEMDALLRDAGFETLALARDDDGIFTVSLARRKSIG